VTSLGICLEDEIGAYGYVEKPWFLPHVRLAAFSTGLRARGLDRAFTNLRAPAADDADLLLFHTPAHLERVRRLCAQDEGALDHGPTLARVSIERAATHVVGAVMDAARRILRGDIKRAFIPIAGFHHAHTEEARAYCLYNDSAIVLRFLVAEGLAPIAYVDVDAHHGDGVYGAFASDQRVVIADMHEDGRMLFPHSPDAPGPGPFSGDANVQGEGPALGTKLNLPMPAGATDVDFHRAWDEIETFVTAARPAFIVFESGADGLAGDPMAHLRFTPAALGHATRRMRAIADEYADGRLLVLGGGGYETESLVAGWCAVVDALAGG
jgi:acetoin utilization protein AcuC